MVAMIETKQDFIEQVIFDGRYLGEFDRNPQGVAERLKLSISDSLCEELRSCDPTAVLGDATSRISEKLAEQTLHTAGATNPELAGPTVGVGTAIGIIAIGIAAIAIVEVCKKSPAHDNVIDHSELAHMKP